MSALASAVVFAVLAAVAGAAQASDTRTTSAFAAVASPAPYPPTTTPCAISWAPAQADPNETILVASGLGASQQVEATLHPQSTTIGSWVTDADGALEAQVSLPVSTGAQDSWVTVSSHQASCGAPTPGPGPASRRCRHRPVRLPARRTPSPATDPGAARRPGRGSTA